ncbi:MAG: hypothetical protein COB04_11555 [Gammaproteobacteria bacterium]|nr:MAG: hypothetical protein COB04_11555 [Gammaproteobacteria bacterium]
MKLCNGVVNLVSMRMEPLFVCMRSVLSARLLRLSVFDYRLFGAMPRVWAVLLAVGMLLGFSAPVAAVEVKGLYDAQVLVGSQQRVERRAASQDALAEIIVRVTGQSVALQNPQIQAMLLEPEQFVNSFSYHSSSQVDYDEENNPIARLQLMLSFDGAAIKGRLKQQQMPIWGENRPQVLVWWATEQQGQRSLVNFERSPVIANQILENGARRGLPLDFPLLDIQDVVTVEVRDVWGFFKEPILEASQRYGAEAVLMGRNWQLSENQWRGTWILQVGSEEFWYEGDGSDASVIYSQAMDFVADVLGRLYAIRGGEENASKLRMVVTGVNQLEDYAALQRYLDTLSAVRAHSLNTVVGKTLTYDLELDTDVVQLKQLIRLDRKLSLQQDDFLWVDDTPSLEFRWNGS